MKGCLKAMDKSQAYRDHGGHLLVADHSGSGKTLAYLIPIMMHLRAHEISSGSRFAHKRSPAVIILAPTQELCSQVRASTRHWYASPYIQTFVHLGIWAFKQMGSRLKVLLESISTSACLPSSEELRAERPAV